MLDQRITFQRNTPVSDGMGGQTKAWADLSDTPTVWANAKPVRGMETLEDGGTVAKAQHLFTIRYRDDVSELDRIVWRDESYNIRTVKRTSGRELFLVIEAERGVAS